MKSNYGTMKPEVRTSIFPKAKLPSAAKRNGVIMFPSAHDITLANVKECAEFIVRCLDNGNHMLIVSKMAVAVADKLIIAFGTKYRGQVEFRVTIGSACQPVLTFWEPGAPPYLDRLHSLRMLNNAGFFTSVSMEPILDSDPKAVVDEVWDLVTPARGIWLGLPNRLVERISLNCPGNENALDMARGIVKHWSDAKVLELVDRFKNDPLIRWKDSIKRVAMRHGITLK